MRQWLRTISLIILFLPIVACGKATNKQDVSGPVAATANFQEGKDYAVIDVGQQIYRPPVGNVQVVEFFNYGCPACNRFEPTLEAWLAKKPANVGFERVPVVFEPNWDIYAKAFYAAKGLGIEQKLSPLIFKAIHEQGMDLSTPQALGKFFAQQGVDPKDFDSAFNFSPGIDAQLMRGANLMQSYGVIEIPTMVVNGHYRVNPAMVSGDANKLLAVVDYLIAKEQQAHPQG